MAPTHQQPGISDVSNIIVGKVYLVVLRTNLGQQSYTKQWSIHNNALCYRVYKYSVVVHDMPIRISTSVFNGALKYLKAREIQRLLLQ